MVFDDIEHLMQSLFPEASFFKSDILSNLSEFTNPQDK